MSDGTPRPTDPVRDDDPWKTADAPHVDVDGDAHDAAAKAEPGGPYFGRLLIVLFAAVAFCAVITWYLSTSVAP